jgi:hypothetical protein
MVAAVSKIMRIQDLILVAKKMPGYYPISQYNRAGEPAFNPSATESFHR